jgi:hypothetical protein
MIQNKKFSIHLLRLSLRIIARPSFIKGLSVLIISMFILFPVFVFAEGGHMPFENSFQNDQWIEGNISDEEGTPLLGVTVYEQNSTNGTISDKEGHYRIMVSDNAQILVFQSVGKQTQKVEIGGRTRIDIVMTEEVYGIDEVVVTALGIKKLQKSIGYSTQKVAGEVLTKAQEPNIISNLTGRVAGLTVYNSTDFFATSSLRLRGERPLIVIDGIPNENSDLWEVNGDDIESIDILKGRLPLLYMAP